MSIEKLREESLKWVEANKSKRFSGVTKLLTDLYPDNAHFIYELLQNAEDARDKSIANSSGASVVRFILSEDALEFEHNGTGLFTLEDVGRITGIGDSAKGDDPTSIGKFGIGFKAVFAYTNTPEIHSGEFHFRIHDLVVPEPNGVTRPHMGEPETRFIFPFDNPKKPSKQALAEIEEGLRALGDNTLLFLSHIRKIEYLLPDGSLGTLKRIDHEGGRIEIRASHPRGTDTVSHWLRFQKEVDVMDEDAKPKTCRIAVAYSIVEEEDKKKRKSTWKIVPLDRGQVSIYFPAEKETSNLRFHLHAPFASTVARDSVRDCKANQHLCNHVADLIVESLCPIRDQGLLTVGFLAVLPNIADNLPPFYESIRTAIVHAFKNEPLTPTKCGTHAKADRLYRGPAKITDALNDDDLSLLTSCDPPLWAANPPQQNQREDRFLDSLKIDEWGWGELAEAMSKPYRYPYSDQQKEDKQRIEDWIAGKDDAWLMRFYALLGDACETHDETVDVSGLRIVRVETDHRDAEHMTPREAFFPPDAETTPPTNIRFVKPTVYSTGRAEDRKKFATVFLKKIGVRAFDAKAVIELKLIQYRIPPSQVRESYYKDIKQFIAYWKKNPAEGGIFSNQAFLLGVSHDNKLSWQKPDQLCLDKPYMETGLSEFVSFHGKKPIYDSYKEKLSELQLKDFTEFLKAIGVTHMLKVETTHIHNNPYWQILWQGSYGIRETDYAIRQDYNINHIDKYLATKATSASRLIWLALIYADANSAKAKYRPNSAHPIRAADSQLVYHLKRHAWVPDKSGEFKKPQDMTKDDLRRDFPYDDRNGLLSAIDFGENQKKQTEEYKTFNALCKNMGFNDEIVDFINELKGISPDEQKQLKDFIGQLKTKKLKPSFPEKESADPERRASKIKEKLADAPEKEYEVRERSVRTTAYEIKPEVKIYLRNNYTNGDGEMICQICEKEMPFKLDDGSHYFEAVEYIKDFPKESRENYLALCPICAAKYKHANASKLEDLRSALLNNDNGDLSIPLTLARESRTLRFVKIHLDDLKAVTGKK